MSSSARERKWKVDVADAVLRLREQVDVMQKEPEEQRLERMKRKGKVKKGDPIPEDMLAKEKEMAENGLQERPEGSFDLFQQEMPRTFAGAIGRPDAWNPPKLKVENALSMAEPFWSWTGPPDRIELIKSLHRVVNVNGQPLSEVEFQYAIYMFESMEDGMVKENWASSFRIATDLVRRFPNWALIYFKAGLLLSVQTLVEKSMATKRARDSKSNNIATEQGFLDEIENTEVRSHVSALSSPSTPSDSESISRQGADSQTAMLDLATMNQSACFFRCCVDIEPFNLHLRGLIDLFLRLANQMFVSRTCAYRDPTLYPRSLGDALAFSVLEKVDQHTEI